MREFIHEAEYRGADVMRALVEFPVTVCGAGAIGANLVETLARQGFTRLRVIDHDRVEPQNVGTQPYGVEDVGAYKAELLANLVFRATGADLDVVRKTLTADNARKLLRDSGLVVDAFDNHAGRAAVRAACQAAESPCLHAGLNGGYGEVRWDAHYVVPQDVPGDICDYPLARNLIQIVVAIAAEAVVRFVGEGKQESYTVTLGDLRVSPW